MSDALAVAVRDLKEHDILEDGRVVSGIVFGPSTHNPAVHVWFDDGTPQASQQTFHNPMGKVRVASR